MTGVSRRRWILDATALVAIAFTTSALAADADVRRALAPTGKLRVGVYLGSPTSMLRDAKTGEPKGVSYDVGKQLAARLGVPFEAVEYPRVALVVDALKAGEVDFTVTNASPARMQIVDFTPPILALELGYLVPRGSKIAIPADIDRPGRKVGVTQGSSSEGKLRSQFKQAAVVTAPTVKDAIAMLTDGRVDVYATNKAILSEMTDALPGSRILDGRWGVEHMAIGVPQGRTAGAAYIKQFAEDVRSTGLVKRAAERAGLRGVAADQ